MSSTSDIGYVLLPRDKAQTSSEARQIVTERLEKYRSFYMDNLTKLPFIPFFDWMEIGGEFTGALYPNGIREKFLDKAKNLIDDYGNNENVIKANHKKLDSLWNELYSDPNCQDHKVIKISEDCSRKKLPNERQCAAARESQPQSS